MFEAVLDDLPTVCTPAGGRRCRPGKVHGDKGYDYRHCRAYLTRRGIKVRIARRGVESSERLGRHRWKAERTIAWLFGCRRLRVRYDRASERFYAFAMLACARLCYNRRVSADTDHPPRSPPTSPVPKCPLSTVMLGASPSAEQGKPCLPCHSQGQPSTWHPLCERESSWSDDLRL